METCQRNFGVSFPITKRAKVNGPETNAVYK
jgi:glutathione peroxidase-family protein